MNETQKKSLTTQSELILCIYSIEDIHQNLIWLIKYN